MKLRTSRGDNILEYVITFLFVGFVVGYALYSINPQVFKNFFMSTFSNTQNAENNTITIGPLTE